MKKRYNHIIKGIQVIASEGNAPEYIFDFHFDSREIQSGDLFVAISGTIVDGHDYIDKAIEKGAKVIVHENQLLQYQEGVYYIRVASSAMANGMIAANYFGHPSKKIKLVGVTGTNGKTSTVTLLHRLFRALGYNAGMLSTVVNIINDTPIPSTHTTPDAKSLNQLLSEMIESGCTHCFMEVSSHALVQGRVAGLEFSGALFTNISHDHLDYHHTFSEYIKAKKMLFDGLPKTSFALVNANDKRGRVMLQNCKAKPLTFAVNGVADYTAQIMTSSFEGLELHIDHQSIWFGLVGKFNAYNLLGVYAIATELGEDTIDVLTTLSVIKTAKGRFEHLSSPDYKHYIIDYAHTPDALENVLNTIGEVRTGQEQVITVVGCGGNRDQEKRPLMADIATKLSDKVILTSDNPRDESPQEILEQMKIGVHPSMVRKMLVIEDRAAAITTANMLAQANDIILIAGKGHEDYQEIKGVKHPFSDHKIVQNLIKESNHK